MTLSTTETVVVPLPSEGLDVLSDDSNLALLALGCSSLSALGLAVHAPGIAVLLNVRHAMLERVATLCTEEVPIVPVLTKRNDVLAQDGRLAVFATRGEEFVPIKVAVEAQAIVSIL